MWERRTTGERREVREQKTHPSLTASNSKEMASWVSFFPWFKTSSFVLVKAWVNPSHPSNYSTCAVLLKYSTEAGSIYNTL
jgi:hypothetical protein